MPITEMFDLTGKRALVTGASSGLGDHFARVLSEAGAEVVVAARRLEKLEELAEDIRAKGGKALPIAMDVTKADSVNAAFEKIAAECDGPCDIIINNSGIGQASWFQETSEEEWQSIVDTNLTGVWRVAKAATNALIDTGKPGSIINISSITALQPSLMNVGYGGTKAAVDHMTRDMAVEICRYGIRVNAIAPGYYKTAINDQYLESEHGEKMRKRIPMRRFGQYHELTGPLLLLASDAGSYMTGETIRVDGGHILMPL